MNHISSTTFLTVPTHWHRAGQEPETIIAPGETVVLFEVPGVGYTVSHPDSLQPTRTTTTTLKNGTVRRDTKNVVRRWWQEEAADDRRR